MADNYQIDVTLEEIFGTGIQSVEQTVVSHDPGGVNIWTVTLTNGVQTQMEVRNGDSGGAPVPAYSASEMTDTSAIYLYLGNETGYIAGHWYVFNDGAWVDYGMYGYPDEAAERIDEFEEEMENRYDLFVARHSGTPGETVLADFTNVFDNGLWWDKTQKPVLSDFLSNYDYVDIKWKHRHQLCLQRFPTSDFDDTTGVGLRDTFAMSSSVQQSAWLQVKRSLSGGSGGDVLELSVSMIDGVDISSASAQTGIISITGIKVDVDPEVTDIRLGADGTVYPSAGAAVRAQITDLQNAISGGGMSTEFKIALENLVSQLAFKGDDPTGQTYIDALHTAMYPPATLTRITAVYTQSGTVYNTDSLDDLKDDLVVTAFYDNSTSEAVTTYTLSGELTVGTSTITVSYGGKTATFNVTVTEMVDPSTEWEDGVPYTLTVVSNTYIDNNGNEAAYNGWDSLDYLPCYGAARIIGSRAGGGNVQSMPYCAWYDVNKTFLSKFTFGGSSNTVTVPEGAGFFRLSGERAKVAQIESLTPSAS